MSAPQPLSTNGKTATGIAGLDDILLGGLPRHRFYLIQGDPGVGKTTMGLQFLLEGIAEGENALYITLSETHDELLEVARSHQWDLSALSVLELSAIESYLAAEAQTTLFHPAEVELNQISKVIMDKVVEVAPARVVFDSLSELRLLAQNPLRYRRQLLALKQFFAGRKCTVYVMDDRTSDHSEREVQSIAHGVIQLEKVTPDYGAERRRLTVVKVRGVPFNGGHHDYAIRQGGIVVFPRIVSGQLRSQFSPGTASSGIAKLDALLSGGLDRGTSNLIMGPPGSGKSTIAAGYATAAAERGERVTIFTFDESPEVYVRRAEALGMRLKEHLATKTIELHQIDPAELSPGEFASRICQSVQDDNVRMVVIDSINGYLHAMAQERLLTAQLHELFSFLSERGVVTIIVLAQHGLLGAMQSPVDVTYLADTVIVLRYFEVGGAVKQAISVIKKRSGDHERTIRELQLSQDGIHVGDPLTNFHGVLTGVPTFDAQSTSTTTPHLGKTNS